MLTHRTRCVKIRVSKEGEIKILLVISKQRTAREEGKNKQEKQRIKLKRKGEKQNGKKLDGV